MKKTIFSVVMVLATLFSISACSSDDDASGNDNECKTCDALLFTIEYCDNGDGTVTATTLGESTVTDLGDITFAEFIEQQEQAGITCE